MATETRAVSPAEHLERRIQENLEWAARWRAENGDPGEAMGAFLREWIGLEALEATYDEYRRHRHSFMFDDYDVEEDGEDADEDARQPG